MKRFFQVQFLFALSIGFLLFEGCTTDESPLPGISPTVGLISDIGFLSADATIPAGDSIKLLVSASSGTDLMKSVAIQRDFSNVPLSEVAYNGVAASANPRLLFDTEKESFTWEIFVAPHTSGAATYTVFVDDDGGESDEVSITVTIEDPDPTITLSAGGNFIAGPGMFAGFDLSVETNGVDLSTIAILQEGTLIMEADRIYLGGIMAANEFTTNPMDLMGDDILGMVNRDVFVRAQNTAGTTVNYTLEITNIGGKTASAPFTITTSGTDIDATFTAVLLENATSVNPSGGINLYDGATVSVFSANANIIDQGEDASDNWLQQIGTVNGSNLKKISQGQIDGGYVFEDILYKEQIIDSWNDGDNLSLGISDVVAVGDIFFVEVDNDYFVIQCVEINTTPQGNSLDNYKFDIKKAEY